MRRSYTSRATPVNAILDKISSSAQVLMRMVPYYHRNCPRTLALGGRDRIGRGGVGDGRLFAVAAKGDLADRESFADLEETRLGRQIAPPGLAQEIDVEVDGLGIARRMR